MITPKEAPSREVLERIADDYRRRGYQVIVGPRGPDLPEFLSDATPDIIARGAHDSIVIEVKERPEHIDPAKINAVAQRVREQPGWQFVLMAARPHKPRPSEL